jgi:iron complex outermembrane receptor protein
MNAADNTMSVWNQFAFGRNAQWNAGLGVFYMGERPANLIAPTPTNPGGNTVILPGYTRVDASVGFDRHAWRLTLYMENLTDEHYLTARGPVLHPNPPRSARLSLAYRF